MQIYSEFWLKPMATDVKNSVKMGSLPIQGVLQFVNALDWSKVNPSMKTQKRGEKDRWLSGDLFIFNI